MSAKSGSIVKAHEVFDKMPQRNVILCNVMIARYAQNRFGKKALETFKKMSLAGVKPNFTTSASILCTCARMGASKHGMDIHENIKAMCFNLTFYKRKLLFGVHLNLHPTIVLKMGKGSKVNLDG